MFGTPARTGASAAPAASTRTRGRGNRVAPAPAPAPGIDGGIRSGGLAESKSTTGADWESDFDGGSSRAALETIASPEAHMYDEPDCGRNGYLHLSMARALRSRDETHPRRIVLVDDGNAGSSHEGFDSARTPSTVEGIPSPARSLYQPANSSGGHSTGAGNAGGSTGADDAGGRIQRNVTTGSAGSGKRRTLRTHVSADAEDNRAMYSLAPFPICGTSTGSHAACGMDGAESEFSRFGLGISLYFKNLKTMGVFLLIISVLGGLVPSLFYTQGSGVSSVGSTGGVGESAFSLSGIVSLTAGNLGDGTMLCAEATEHGELTLSCGDEGRVLGEIFAYYGQPTGSCDCPTAQTPSPTCPAVEAEDGECDPPGGYCIAAKRRRLQHPDGNHIVRGSCCAQRRDSTQLPDFQDLDIRRNEKCDAEAAARVVLGVCGGKSSCRINASPDVEYTWVPVPGAPCKTAIERNSGSCRSRLAGGISDSVGVLSNCDRDMPVRLIAIARCVEPFVDLGGGGRISKDVLAIFAALFDVGVITGFLLFIRWLRAREELEEWQVENSHIRAKDYTIELRDVPKHRDLDSLDRRLRKHFEKVLSHPLSSWTHQPYDVRVADINFGVRHSGLIAAFKKRGAMLRDLERKQKELVVTRKTTVKNLALLNLSKVSMRSLAPLNDTVRNIAQQDRVIDDIQRDARQSAVRVYVTFADREGFNRAMDQYATSSRLFQPQRLRLGGHRLLIRQAPDPSSIIWENLEYSRCNRCLRGAITGIASLVLIAISAMVLFAVEDAKRGALQSEEGLQCSALSGDVLNKSAVVVDELSTRFNATVGQSGRLACYCDAVASEAGVGAARAVRFDDTGLDASGRGDSPFWCVEWANDRLVAQMMTSLLAFTVVGVNLLLRALVNLMVPFERPHTRSEDMLSRMRKLFWVQLINTGFLIAIVNTRIPGVSPDEAGLVGGGTFDDFTPEWYAAVGVPIILSMVGNIVSPHAMPLLAAFLIAVQRCWDRGCTCDGRRSRKLTQTALEKLYHGPEFHLAERYSQTAMTIWVAFSYSAGIPLLPLLAAFFFIVTYWVDKVLFVRFYRKPPHYDASIARAAMALLPWAIVAHFTIGLWMLSSPGVFVSDNVVAGIVGVTGGDSAGAAQNLEDSLLISASIVERLTTPHAIIMMVALVVSVAYAFVDWVWENNKGLAKRLCCKSVKPRRADQLEYPSYTDALRTSFFERALLEGTIKARLKDEYTEILRQRRTTSNDAPTAGSDDLGNHGSTQRFSSRLNTDERAGLQSTPSDRGGRYITGVSSYDLNHNPEYRRIMGLDMLVDPRARRGVKLHRRQRRRHRTASAHEEIPTPSSYLATIQTRRLGAASDGTPSPPVTFALRLATATEAGGSGGSGSGLDESDDTAVGRGVTALEAAMADRSGSREDEASGATEESDSGEGDDGEEEEESGSSDSDEDERSPAKPR